MRHYARANNKLVAEYLDKQSKNAMEIDDAEAGYDSSKETSYIFCTDCTNEVKITFLLYQSETFFFLSMVNV